MSRYYRPGLNEARRQVWRNVACSKCGAKAGERCVGAFRKTLGYSYERRTPHRERYNQHIKDVCQ